MMCVDNLFRGKRLLHIWLEENQDEFRSLVALHGREKFNRVYDWTFRYMSAMRFGQWLVIEKIAPSPEARRLFLFVMELIYQSDLVSHFRVERKDGETHVVMVEPTEEKKKSLAILLGNGSYILADWYGRLLADPNADDSIRPEWLGLESLPSDAEDILNDNITQE